MACNRKIDKNTSSALSSALNVFSLPPTNVAYANSNFREMLPLNPVTDQPYTFRVFADNLWVDLSKIYLQLEFNCQKKDATDDEWTKIDAGNEKIAPIENIGKTFIRQLKVNIGNDEVYDSGTLYSYRAQIIDELSIPLTCKKTSAAASGYSYTTVWDDASNQGFKARARTIAGGQNVHLISRLDFDMANQPLLLLNNTSLMFTLYRASDDFIMEYRETTTGKARLNVSSLKLFVRVVDVQPALNLEIYKALEQKPAQYAVRKTEVRSCFLTGGRTEFDQTLFSSLVPRRVILGLVGARAFNGSQNFSPFNFKPYDLQELSIIAGGQQYPTPAYSMNFSRGQYIRPYLDLLDSLGVSLSANTPGITPHDFRDGWTLFVVSLSPSAEDCSGAFELVRGGTTTIHLRFGTSIPADGVELIVLAEFDQVISIDRDRRVFTDLTV